MAQSKGIGPWFKQLIKDNWELIIVIIIVIFLLTRLKP